MTQTPERPEGEEDVIGIAEIILIGIALSADAMSVTICNLLANPTMSRARMMSLPVAFGLFQGLMPALGYFAGSFAASLIDAYAGIVAFVILGLIGGKMIHDGVRATGEFQENAGLGFSMIVMQAIATSIDAFAVGVSFVSGSTPIAQSACIIAACTFALCCLMLLLGRKLGALLGERSQIVGGVILVLIGIKAVLF
jgi:putative Mn2+ efflux pump MntP